MIDPPDRPVDRARTALNNLPEEQRLALFIEVVSALTNSDQALQVRRAARVANAVADRLFVEAFVNAKSPKTKDSDT